MLILIFYLLFMLILVEKNWVCINVMLATKVKSWLCHC